MPRGPSRRPSLQFALRAVALSLASSAYTQPSDTKPIKQLSPTPIFLDYSRIPHVLGDYVMAVFEKKASKPVYDRVAAAMSLDTFKIEEMTTDTTVNNLNRWKPSLERRAKILPIAQRILSLPEKEVDVWNVSLTLAKDAYPDLDTKKLTQDFEAVVERIRRVTPPDANPDRRVRTMNTILYKKMGIGYDKDDLTNPKLINRYAFGVLKTNRGDCVNLALFYIAVAQRLGYPVYAVAAPQHLFARYVDLSLKMQNIDPSGQGGYDSDEAYIRKLDIPPCAVKNGTFLRTRSYRELAAYMVADHGGFYYGQVLKDDVVAIAILERAVDHTKQDSDLWYLLGEIHKHWGFQELIPDVREIKFIRALVFMQKAKRMGLGKSIEQELKERKEREERRKFQPGPGV